MENLNETGNPIQNPVQIPEESKSSGALIGTVVVILVLVLGGYYFWSTMIKPKILINQTEQSVTNNSPLSQSDPALDKLQAQSPSDETASIASDLAATDIPSIDKGLQAL